MMDKRSNRASDVKIIKKLTLHNGFRVGIVNLDIILQKVADLKLVEVMAIKAELLKKAAVQNYIPSSAETDYSAALFEEYQLKFGGPGAVKDRDKTEIYQHTKG